MSQNLEKTYNPKEIEDKLYQKWCENKYFHAEVDRSKKPFTIVMPPPNITGKLHMGHALDNTIAGYSDPLQENAGIQCTVGSGNRPCGYFYRSKGYQSVKRRRY